MEKLTVEQEALLRAQITRAEILASFDEIAEHLEKANETKPKYYAL
jgi:hypothetical protein